MEDIEHAIISATLSDKLFASKTLGKISKKHFKGEVSASVFEEIQNHFSQFSKIPTRSELKVRVNSFGLDKETQEEANSLLNEIPDINSEFIVNEAEKYCRDREIALSLFECVDLTDSGDPKKISAIPDIMSRAISYSFTFDMGLDYYGDIQNRVKSYTDKNVKIPFKLSMLNKITEGGMEAGTLNVFPAPTGFGKTIFMADDALFQTKQGRNVIYFTFEMDATRIAKRIDSNDLDMEMKSIRSLDGISLTSRFEKQSQDKNGKFIIKELPSDTTAAIDLAQHIRLTEIELDVKIDVVYVDYINLMYSTNESNSSGTYKKIEGVCKELINHIAKDFKVPVISATQLTRGAQESTGIGISHIAESQGLSNTVDLLIAMHDTEELRENKWARFKQLKNRYGSKSYYNAFIVGLNYDRMKFFDVDESASDELVDNIVSDRTTDKKTSERLIMDENFGKEPKQKRFSNFNF